MCTSFGEECIQFQGDRFRWHCLGNLFCFWNHLHDMKLKAIFHFHLECFTIFGHLFQFFQKAKNWTITSSWFLHEQNGPQRTACPAKGCTNNLYTIKWTDRIFPLHAQAGISSQPSSDSFPAKNLPGRLRDAGTDDQRCCCSQQQIKATMGAL